MLASVWGREDARRAWSYLRRLYGSQSARWPWLRRLAQDDPGLPHQMVLVAASEAVLLHYLDGGGGLFARPEGGSSILVRGWAAACAWAYRLRDWEPSTMIPATVPLDDWLEWEGPAPGDGPEVDLSCLSGRQAEVVAGRVAGLTFAEIAAVSGTSAPAVTQVFRRAVARLLDHNPGLAGRFGLRPCPGHSRACSWCARCRGWGWTYTDGTPLGRDVRQEER